MAGCSSELCSTFQSPITYLVSSAANLNTDCSHNYALNGRNHKFQTSQDNVTSHKISSKVSDFFCSVIYRTSRTATNCTKSNICDWFLCSQCFPFTKTCTQKGAITFQIRAKITCKCSLTVIQNEKENMSTFFFLIHKFQFRENPRWKFSTCFTQGDRNSDASRCASFIFWLRTRQNNMLFTVCE